MPEVTPADRLLEVLVIEHNPDDRYLIQEGLSGSVRDFALKVRIAEDSEQAVAMLQAEGYRPDMIFFDLSLPPVNGQNVLQLIRSQGFDLDGLPVIVFSSSRHNIQEVLDAGANAYIVRPTSLTAYLKAIERFAVLFIKSRVGAAA